MKKRGIKIISIVLVIVTITALMAVPASATWMYPDGATVYDYLVNTDDYNRTIYVYHRDTSGNLLKYCVYYTETHGDYDVFGDSLYGYDIVAYESNQGLGEQCRLTWAAGNDSKAGYGQVGYEFYKLISKKSLTIDFTYEKHEPTTFYIKHYTVDKNGSKTLYDSSTSVYTYGNSMSIYRKYPTGYSLRTGYQSSITGKFTYDVLDIEENVDSRLYYDYHKGSHSGEMKYRNSYSESSKDYLDYCDNREIKVDFYYDLNKYTVTFNANGGSGAPSSVTKYYGETVALPTTTPTRSGYTFSGWGTYSSDTSANYQPGSNYSSNSSSTLYAIWTANVPEPETYTVSYNANGGSGAPSAQVKTENVTLTLSSTKPTRSGYTFKGWSTSKTATSPTYYAGGSYTANASATLYAVWEQNAPTTYTVSYNANGGSGAPSSQTKTHNVTLTLSSTKPTRSGYTFLGWSTSSTATSPTYYASGSYTANASATLYAVWSKNAPATYTVSFNANGGSGAPSSVTKTDGVTLYLPTTEPYRSNYEFLGWSTSSTATSPTYYAGGSFSRNANTTLYAVWEYSPETYTVRYNANGGTGAPSSQTKTYGVNLTLSSTIPSRSGYNFLGWSTSSTATSATYSAGGSYTANAGATLYAVWEKANYEFSISNLTVSDSEPYRYGTITVKVRTDSWDQKNPYSDIPVQLYYDGQLMSTQYVDFAAYGVANLTFTLYVGDTPGNRSIEARINWLNRSSETNTGNNSVSTSINVKDFDYEMSVEDVTVSNSYIAGETVISSFTVRNDSGHDITPDKGNKAKFTAYY